MARFVIEVAEIHNSMYEIDDPNITTAEQARDEFYKNRDSFSFIDDSTRFSHELSELISVYDDDGELIYG